MTHYDSEQVDYSVYHQMRSHNDCDDGLYIPDYINNINLPRNPPRLRRQYAGTICGRLGCIENCQHKDTDDEFGNPELSTPLPLKPLKPLRRQYANTLCGRLGCIENCQHKDTDDDLDNPELTNENKTPENTRVFHKIVAHCDCDDCTYIVANCDCSECRDAVEHCDCDHCECEHCDNCDNSIVFCTYCYQIMTNCVCVENAAKICCGNLGCEDCRIAILCHNIHLNSNDKDNEYDNNNNNNNNNIIQYNENNIINYTEIINNINLNYTNIIDLKQNEPDNYTIVEMKGAEPDGNFAEMKGVEPDGNFAEMKGAEPDGNNTFHLSVKPCDNSEYDIFESDHDDKFKNTCGLLYTEYSECDSDCEYCEDRKKYDRL